MCLSIPSKIVNIDKDKNMATVDTMGVQREAALDLMEDESLTVGDYVLIHIGFIMNKIDEVDALASLETYKELLDLDDKARAEVVLSDDNCTNRESS